MGLFDSFSSEVAVDLGTANTLIYVKGKDIVLNEPSVVAVDNDTGKVIAIGNEAKRMLGRTPDNIRAVRPMKDGVIADFEVTEEMLREYLKRVLRNQYIIKPRVVICVPSGITEVEKRAVRDSAENAGARDVYLVKEPMAAAIGVGVNVEEPSGNMIIDIGGGTSEIAVISLSGIVKNTSIRVGGDEMDEAIIAYLKKNFNLLVGERTAEEVKMTIGSAFAGAHEKDADMDVRGQYLPDGLPRTIRINAAQIREALQEPINAIVTAVRAALEITPPELASDIMEKGIIMTGGGALLKGLDKKLKHETDLMVNVVEHPLLCVVRGAGKIVEDPQRYAKMIMKSRRD